jgi:hypothetical protein
MGNFGVYQPPSGKESVARSRQIQTDFIISANPLLGSLLGLTPADLQVSQNQGSLTRSNQLDLDSISELNNPSRRFDEMAGSGWGGGEKQDYPRSTNDASTNENRYPSNPIMPSSLSAEMPNFFFLK